MNMNINHIYSNHNIIGTIYISDFFKSNGNKLVFDQLQALRQDSYNPNDRIVIIYDRPDHYSYADLPGDSLITLQKYLTQLDITNCFVLAVSSIPTIANECYQVQKLYSADDWPIQHQLIEGLTTNIVDCNDKQDTLCALPWMHLYVGPDGNVLPCCVADQTFPMGNINDTSVDSILKSSKFNRLRENMLSGKRSKECNRCYAQEDAGLESLRQEQNARWSHQTLNFNTDGTLDKFEPVYLDIRLNNICNLKCRMCSGYFSSAIAQEESILFGNQLSQEASMVPAQRSMALTEITEYLPHVENIYFAGGEPLLTPEHYKILNSLIKCGNTDLEIRYNTNFTSLAYKDISVLELWKKFSQVKVGASLDAMGTVAEYIRHGTKWSTIESNLELLKLQCPHVDFTVTSTVGFLNVSSLIELQRTWHENKILNISKFSMGAMVGPDHLTLTVLPKEYKDQFDYKIKHHIDWCHQNQATALAKQWTDMLQYMWSKDSSHFLSDFKRLTNSMDQFRNESLSLVLPEFSNFI